ncbi:MAG: DNA mismatch endonuclease Vsr [Rubrivivax sp.]|nr:DNA mismatch endonuclease Vsr [Rubrivivax sp.]
MCPPISARTRLMKRVRREHTAPELAVRRFLHSAGLRYALHGARLPGRPDLVLPRRCTVVFVHGCFWHGHDCSHGSVQSKTNAPFWARKIADNRARDARQQDELRAAGWRVEVVWECQATDESFLRRLARRLLRR